ncbi:type I methionyl aminopeptidase [soil metagenome]
MHQTNEIYLKSPSELAIMRRAGHKLEEIMAEVYETVQEGVTTAELDKLAYHRIKEAGGRPGFLGLYDFPNTLCISVNEQVVHGIPGKRKLLQGDIVSVDCGLVLQDFFADMAFTAPVGKISPEAKRLLTVTEQSLKAGIAAAQPGGRVSDIGAAIEQVVRAAGYHIVENYTGHGVGRKLHEEPKVYNTAKPRGPKITAGMTLAVEPMINIGTSRTEELNDGWTVVTVDRSLSAHFEHTIAVTMDGIEVLTRSGNRQWGIGDGD